ncbi:MAG: hypothetical protein K8L91_06440 [Anaerolineae bacterium]|nr:hypothetical protein [Anaerolineae bacterium]
MGLLKYDHTFADFAVLSGVLIALSAIVLGIWTAWVFPRLRLGNHSRFQGDLLKATTSGYSPDGMPKM